MAKLAEVFLVILAVAAADGSARSQSLQVSGKAGYLSEWELSGTVLAANSAEEEEFSGPLIWKHVGLCSVSGPEEKHGEIRFRLAGPSSSPRISGIMSIEGDECRYSADLSSGSSGHMDCPAAKGIPLSISIK
jgi:hypothetical protein